MDLFNVEPISIDVGDVTISAATMGSGPPVLLLHGYPQTKAMWHRVAPVLAESHTVVAADLRGYGDSSKPAGDVYDKRAMAGDQFALMTELGFERFAVIGHDRGARVAHRMALDAIDRIAAVGVLDIVPTLHMFEHVDRAMAESYFHWFFLTRGGGMPERLIEAAPDVWLETRFGGRHRSADAFDPRAAAEYRRCWHLPGTIAATCADYRAAATVDLEHDRADRVDGRLVEPPLLALWGEHGYVGRNFDVADVWADFAASVTPVAVESDHYVAEDAGHETATALMRFLEQVGA
ncbi:MAG: alpha/beta hydrolase [Pseudoclavibacter sp.]